MTSKLRCPVCGSTDVECIETDKAHVHECIECSYTITVTTK